MDFMFSKSILAKAKLLAAEMLQTGEKIKEMKLGENGLIYLSSEEDLVEWVKAFELSGAQFFIGAKK